MKWFALLTSLLLVAGCATKNYGTQSPLTEFEWQNLTCHEIQMEQAKVMGFAQQVDKEDQFSGRDVLAAFGDLGIGNSLAKANAIDTAKLRYFQLETAAYDKGCTTVKPEPVHGAPGYESRS